MELGFISSMSITRDILYHNLDCLIGLKGSMIIVKTAYVQ